MLRSPSSLVAAAVLGAQLLLATPALACKCMFPPVETARDDATAVFEGRVVSIDQAAGSDATNGERRVSLRVVRTWKGLERDERVEVFTNGSSAACGYSFAQDASYIVYARASDDQKLHVNSCSRTKPVSDSAEDLSFLGAGSTPVTIATSPGGGLDGGTAVSVYVDAGGSYLPPPVPASATPGAAHPRKKGCSIAPGPQTSGAEAWWFALPGLALIARGARRRARRVRTG
ncbi:MAG: uncharacterized protein JWN48_4320 [Myxococcaceae bacterium]|nr:uncharacterized protein [Myxococcaceae bacterium]